MQKCPTGSNSAANSEKQNSGGHLKIEANGNKTGIKANQYIGNGWGEVRRSWGQVELKTNSNTAGDESTQVIARANAEPNSDQRGQKIYGAK